MKNRIRRIISLLMVFGIILSGLQVFGITEEIYAAKELIPGELESQYKARELIDRYRDLDTARDISVFLKNYYSGGLKKITASQLAELEAVGRNAVKGYDTDREKIHRVYEFVARNFFYKKDHDGPSNVYDAWKLKYGVCQDYAALCKLFINAAGIPCIVIDSSRPDEEPHAYNAAYDSQEGRWIYFDATGGSNNFYDNTYWVGESPGAHYGDIKRTEWFEAETYSEHDFDFTAEKAAASHYSGITSITDLTDGTFLYSVITYDVKNKRSLWYSSDEWQLTVTGIKPGSKTSAVISSGLMGLPTKVIGSTFYATHYPELKKITIPTTVDTVYAKAFSFRDPVTLIFQGTVDNIKAGAFGGKGAVTLMMQGDPPTSSLETAFARMPAGSRIYFPCTNPKWSDAVVDSFVRYYPAAEMIRDHDKSRVVSRKAASASEDGYIEYGCSKCGETYREIIPMTGEPEDEGEGPAPADDEDEAEAGDRDDGDEYEIYENPMKATKHDRTFRYKDVKKHAKNFKAITVRKAKGRVSYKVKKGDTGVLTLKKDGRIKVRKGARKGTYSLKVKVSVPETPVGNRLYLAGHDILTVKVKIR